MTEKASEPERNNKRRHTDQAAMAQTRDRVLNISIQSNQLVPHLVGAAGSDKMNVIQVEELRLKGVVAGTAKKV